MWNYRVIRSKDNETDEAFFEICEVYYDQMGKPLGYCGASVAGENIEELRTVLDMISSALTKPVLKNSDFHNSNGSNPSSKATA